MLNLIFYVATIYIFKTEHQIARAKLGIHKTLDRTLDCELETVLEFSVLESSLLQPYFIEPIEILLSQLYVNP